MPNPRKFSEKIALHTQKQAEGTAAYEAIMQEVSATTGRLVGKTSVTPDQKKPPLQMVSQQQQSPSQQQQQTSNQLIMQQQQQFTPQQSQDQQQQKLLPSDQVGKQSSLQQQQFFLQQQQLQSMAQQQQQRQQTDRNHLQLVQPALTQRGRSLPNVNQMCNNAINLPDALSSLKDIERSVSGERAERSPHRRQRTQSVRAKQYQHDKSSVSLRTNCMLNQYHSATLNSFNPNYALERRTHSRDCSPYGSMYLSLPSDQSWRRTSSDSALHSTVQATTFNQYIAENGQYVNNTGSTNAIQMIGGYNVNNPVNNEQQLSGRRTLSGKIRPRSSGGQGKSVYQQSPEPLQYDSSLHVPLPPQNTGSLPDLSTLNFPSPLATPLDTSDVIGGGGYSPQQLQQQQLWSAVNLEATAANSGLQQQSDMGGNGNQIVLGSTPMSIQNESTGTVLPPPYSSVSSQVTRGGGGRSNCGTPLSPPPIITLTHSTQAEGGRGRVEILFSDSDIPDYMLGPDTSSSHIDTPHEWPFVSEMFKVTDRQKSEVTQMDCSNQTNNAFNNVGQLQSFVNNERNNNSTINGHAGFGPQQINGFDYKMSSSREFQERIGAEKSSKVFKTLNESQFNYGAANPLYTMPSLTSRGVSQSAVNSGTVSQTSLTNSVTPNISMSAMSGGKNVCNIKETTADKQGMLLNLNTGTNQVSIICGPQQQHQLNQQLSHQKQLDQQQHQLKQQLNQQKQLDQQQHQLNQQLNQQKQLDQQQALQHRFQQFNMGRNEQSGNISPHNIVNNVASTNLLYSGLQQQQQMQQSQQLPSPQQLPQAQQMQQQQQLQQQFYIHSLPVSQHTQPRDVPAGTNISLGGMGTWNPTFNSVNTIQSGASTIGFSPVLQSGPGVVGQGFFSDTARQMNVNQNTSFYPGVVSGMSGDSSGHVTSPQLMSQQQSGGSFMDGLISAVASSTIPDIVLTAEEMSFYTNGTSMVPHVNKVNDIGSTSAASVDPMMLLGDSFDGDIFQSEVLRLGPLDLDELQMLSDPSLITDPATEDSFRFESLTD